jgi:myo-inositol-1-phosphate synthase
MQIKINFLCRDSILAAPLVIEIARLLDVSRRRGEGGVAEHLSVFFKLPQIKIRPRNQFTPCTYKNNAF